MTLRDSINQTSPGWLQREVGGSIMRAFGTALDALGDRTAQGVKLRYPQVATPTALGAIGNDRNIERSPYKSDAAYALQLRQAVDTWRHAGSPATVMTQLLNYFTPTYTPPAIRTVSEVAVWYELNTSTLAVTKTNVGTNWNWDGLLTHWWRGWLIVNVSGIWTLDVWSSTGTWADGGTWGSNGSTDADIRSLNAILLKWKPANVLGQIILTFASGTFARTNAAPPNPAGNGYGNSQAWLASQQANFLQPQMT